MMQLLICDTCGEPLPGHDGCAICGDPDIAYEVGDRCYHDCLGRLVEAVLVPKSVAEKRLRDECDADTIRDWLSDRDEPCPDGMRLCEHVARVIEGLLAHVVAGANNAAIVAAIERLGCCGVDFDPRIHEWAVTVSGRRHRERWLRAALEAAVAALEDSK